MKKLSLFLVLTMLISALLIDSSIVYANDDNSINSSHYTGTYNGSTPMEFTINSVNKDNGTFTGHIKINHQYVTINNVISGSIALNQQNFVCTFRFSYDWFITTYDATFTITVDPFTGTATGYGGGGILIAGNVSLTGTINPYYNQTLSYSENDMKMCMDLSNAIYDEANEYNKIAQVSGGNHLSFCFEGKNVINDDSNPDNVMFSLLKRTIDDNSIDIIVVIRGTYNEEWRGNVEITGESYDPDLDVHDNFEKAKDSIKEEINNYYDTYCGDYDKVNLIITGHSRGAAVSNLYAKYATDIMNDECDTYAPEGAYDDIPEFDSITAYTFACPNNAKITTAHSESYMKSYDNIFNFCLDSDIVPMVPLTEPETGWNYWKYGRCYTANIKHYYNLEKSRDSTLPIPFFDTHINNNVANEMKTALFQWSSVDDYYNKMLIVPLSAPTTLYQTLHSTLFLMSSSLTEKSLSLWGLRNLAHCPALIPLFCFGCSNAITIGISHHYNTYNRIINGELENGYQGYGDDIFSEYSISTSLRNNSSNSLKRTRNISYNNDEVQKLSTMACYSTNNDILNWDLSDPSTWEGISWNSDGNVTSIDLKYKWLTGTLDCSDFTALTDLNIYGNSFTSLNLSGDISLTSLNCGFNGFSSSGLTLTDCTALTDLFCDGCGLTTINLSTLTDLETLSCSFNNLIALDISQNTSLEHIACIYNYLDISANSTLYNALNGYKTANNAYLNYYPQRITENAIVDADEMLALKNFANIGNNNQILDWLDNSGNISLEKLQYYAIFEYDGTKYRVAALDISGLNLSGSLDLSDLEGLEELYCDETKITELDIGNCAFLKVLSCYNCDIETLTLPSNITSADSPLYSLDCEYNYIDTTMFTQSIIDNISSKDDYVLEYENQKWEDDSALAAVIEFSQGLNGNDYSESSFSVLSDLIDSYEDYENYLLTQDDIDEITAEFLTAISDLEPYLKLKLSGDNGTVTTVYNGETQNGSTHSILFGESVTLTATPDENYTFDGWYERITQRVYSTDSTYTFPMTTNLDFVARFVKQNAAILSFTNDTGQIVSKIDNTPTEWNDVTTLDDLLPDVPYKLGHVNGRWNYIESEVLTALRAGTDVTITPVYDATDYVYPEAPLPVNGNPVLNLTFTYDETNDIGSFIMGAGLPQNLDIESMGIAFYLKNKNTFVPDNYILNINNKAVVSRFDSTVPDNRYIVNVHRFAEKYNWCARGFVTYRDDGALKIAYSNQMNITNTVQNNRRIAISRSVEFSHNIDTIVDDDE